jgi:hypothetical protein
MPDLFTIIATFFIFAFGYFVGSYTAISKMLDIFKEIMGREFDPDELYIDEDQILNMAKSILFKTETVNNILYLYNIENHRFVCQGLTLEELCTRCVESTKLDTIFIVHEKQTYQYNGKVIEKIET